MSSLSPKPDPAEFAKRLRQAMTDCGMNTGRGAGSMLARRYGASQVTANAWLNGTHRADTDRARLMADDLGVRFEWLYFGVEPKRASAAIPTIKSATFQPNEHELRVLQSYRLLDLDKRQAIDTLLELYPRPKPKKPRPSG